MKKLLALFAALALGAIVLLQFDTSKLAPDAGERRSSGAHVTDEGGPITQVAQENERREIDEVALLSEPFVASGPSAERPCVLTGRVVDSVGVPIVGALAQLISVPVWNDAGAGEPITQIAGVPIDRAHGFEVRADDAGVFRFEVPVPKNHSTLHVSSDAFHDRYVAQFWDGHPVLSSSPLAPGLRDLGDIMLVETGAVFGRVVNEAGLAVQGVRIGLGPTPTTTIGHYSVSDDAGNYTIAHAPQGTYGVSARLEGYQQGFVDGVEVRTGVMVGPVELVLTRAETITGTVVDETGEGVAGAEVYARPAESGSSSSVRTKDDGSFTVALASPGSYSLEVSHDNFVNWKSGQGHAGAYPPGTDGLRITLMKAQKLRFVIVASETGEPIERFGIQVLEDQGSATFSGGYTPRRLPRLEEHAGGVTELSARERADGVLVWSEGRLHVDTDVVLDDQSGDTMTIALERGAVATGRLVLDGEGVAGRRVEVVLISQTGHERDAYRRASTTDGDGRFRIDGIDEGTHRLRALAGEHPDVVIEGLSFNPPETLDLGDVEVVRGGTIEGIVHVPAGVGPNGLTVVVLRNKARPTARTDASGRFVLDALAPGEHELLVLARPGELMSSAPVQCIIKSGETTTVEIDATDCAPVIVELTILIDGKPGTGSQVFLTAVERPRSPSISEQQRFGASLGRVDEAGVVTGDVRAFGVATVRLHHPELGGLGHPTARIDVRAGTSVEETVRFDLASVELRLPDVPELPSEGKITITLSNMEDADDVQYIELGIREGALTASDYASLNGATLHLSGLSPGSRDVEVWASKKDAPPVFVEVAGGSRYGPEAMWSYSGSVKLEAGGTASATLD